MGIFFMNKYVEWELYIKTKIISTIYFFLTKASSLYETFNFPAASASFLSSIHMGIPERRSEARRCTFT